MPIMKARGLILGAALAATVTACGSSSGGKTAAPSPAASRVVGINTPPSATPSVPTPSPTPTAPGAGVAQNEPENGPGYAATFFGYEQPIALPYNQPSTAGDVFAYADVQSCVGQLFTDVPTTVSASPWTLHFPDNTQATPSNTQYNGQEQPYPIINQPVAANSCVRGKILFEVPSASRPSSITYTTQDSSGQYVIRTWTVGGS